MTEQFDSLRFLYALIDETAKIGERIEREEHTRMTREREKKLNMLLERIERIKERKRSRRLDFDWSEMGDSMGKDRGYFRKGYDPRRYTGGRKPIIPAKEIRELLNKEIEDGERETAMQAIIRRAIDDAIAGDAQARKWLFDRAYGKVPEIIELDTDFCENAIAKELRLLRAKLSVEYFECFSQDGE